VKPKAKRQEGNVTHYEAAVSVNPLMHVLQIQHRSLTAVTCTNMHYEKGNLEQSFESNKMPCFIKECNSILQTLVLKTFRQFYEIPNFTIRLSDINFNVTHSFTP